MSEQYPFVASSLCHRELRGELAQAEQPLGLSCQTPALFPTAR